ncbi:uncharacterized protein LOC135712204 [Ochlerotatus camptorhynchus]|uniref:uncharacterized protein LOC135712204 n=1 Tax=Ochlerotatus camptorhynchus TaxID=644619 RepID=UPI0031D4B1CE
MWKIINLFALLSTLYPGTSAVGSYVDNAIEQQHKVINEMNQNFTDLEKASEKLINLGTFVGSHKVPPKIVKITNTIAVKVPVPYPVKIPHPVPVPVPVNRPVPYPVPKVIKIPDPTPTPTAPSYATTPESLPTPAALTSRSLESTGASHLLIGEQETAHSTNNEQLQEFVHSYPVHSVYDVGVDYNPYMGNKLTFSKQTGAASESQPIKYHGSDSQQLHEYREPRQKYSNNKHNYAGYRSSAKLQATARPTHTYTEYAYSTGQPESAPSTGQGFQPEVIPNSYKSPTKSSYFSKEYEKYPTPKFPRPTSSSFPTSPTFSTQDSSYAREENHFDGNSFKEYHHKPSSTGTSFHTVKESYPRYEQPNLKQYHYQKPTAESYIRLSENTGLHHKSQKYLEHYQKPTAMSYTTAYHDTEHKEAAESSAHYKQYEQHDESYLTNADTYSGHKNPSEQYETHDLYAKPSASPEAYSQYEAKEPQYTPQEYKPYYAKPTPVSEALSYLEQKEPSQNSEHVVHVKPQSYHSKLSKEHKARYPSKSSTIPYNFPSDSHLHPSYHESKHKPHQYYSSSPEQPSIDEDSRSEQKYYHYRSPSPSPSTHITSYDHASASGTEYQYASQHHKEGSDMLESSSKDHQAYERAVEQDHQATHPNEYAEYSHEHMHHHHPATGDGGRDY